MRPVPRASHSFVGKTCAEHSKTRNNLFTFLLAALSSLLTRCPVVAETSPPSIFDVVSDDRRFQALEDLLVVAELDDNLTAFSEDGPPLTLLAPIDQAFDQLPATILQYLASNATALREVLSYHVVPDRALIWRHIADHSTVPTLLTGEHITFTYQWHWSWHHFRYYHLLVVNHKAVVRQVDIPA